MDIDALEELTCFFIFSSIMSVQHFMLYLQYMLERIYFPV
jgi:hypothetical protein